MVYLFPVPVWDAAHDTIRRVKSKNRRNFA